MQNYINIKPYISWPKLQKIPEHKISYLEYGDPDNKETIICAHGLTRNAHDFHKIATSLSPFYRIISLDYPGRGKSDYFSNPEHYNYPVYIKDSVKILKKLQINKPIWLGTSMGGIIGMALASYYPKMLKGLIINDVGPYIPASIISKIGKYASQTPYFENLNMGKEHLKMIYSQFGITKEEDWEYMTTHSFKQTQEGKFQMNYDPALVKGMKLISKEIKDMNIWHIWQRIICPMLVIRGAKSDILSEETIEKMKKTKIFDLHIVNEAGHAPSLMAEDQIQVVKEWIDKQFHG